MFSKYIAGGAATTGNSWGLGLCPSLCPAVHGHREAQSSNLGPSPTPAFTPSVLEFPGFMPPQLLPYPQDPGQPLPWGSSWACWEGRVGVTWYFQCTWKKSGLCSGPAGDSGADSPSPGWLSREQLEERGARSPSVGRAHGLTCYLRHSRLRALGLCVLHSLP